MSDKIGVAIITYKRQSYFEQAISSLPKALIDNIVVVNDGPTYPVESYQGVDVIQHEENKGVGKSKNDAFKYLLDKKCDHIFLIEDDISIKDINVFDKYIQASKKTGIQHFNYSQHGLMNKYANSDTPSPRVKIEYDKDVSIELHTHCVGAFSYYSKKCIDTVGVFDDNFYNAFDHVEHSYRIIKAEMHPPFWWFADIADSNKYLQDIPWSASTSTISSRSDHMSIMQSSIKAFAKKHGITPMGIPNQNLDDVKHQLKKIAHNK